MAAKMDTEIRELVDNLQQAVRGWCRCICARMSPVTPGNHIGLNGRRESFVEVLPHLSYCQRTKQEDATEVIYSYLEKVGIYWIPLGC